MTTAEVVQKIRETAACCANTNTAWLPAIADLLEAKDAECKDAQLVIRLGTAPSDDPDDRYWEAKHVYDEARRRCDELEGK
jgi:hypothetical protein